MAPADEPPSTADWARVLRAGMSAIGVVGKDDDCDPAEVLGLTVGAEGQPVGFSDLEMAFRQMKVDKLDEPTVLAICRQAMLAEQAYRAEQVAAANLRRKAETRRQGAVKRAAAAAATVAVGVAAQANDDGGEVPETLRALFPALRGSYRSSTAAATTPLEAAELRRVAAQARRVAAAGGSSGSAQGTGADGTTASLISAVRGKGQVEEVEEDGLRRARPTDGNLLSSVDSPSSSRPAAPSTPAPAP